MTFEEWVEQEYDMYCLDDGEVHDMHRAWIASRKAVLTELEKEIEERIEEYHAISIKTRALGDNFEAVAHSHYMIEAQSLLSLIRSMKEAAK